MKNILPFVCIYDFFDLVLWRSLMVEDTTLIRCYDNKGSIEEVAAAIERM